MTLQYAFNAAAADTSATTDDAPPPGGLAPRDVDADYSDDVEF